MLLSNTVEIIHDYVSKVVGMKGIPYMQELISQRDRFGRPGALGEQLTALPILREHANSVMNILFEQWHAGKFATPAEYTNIVVNNLALECFRFMWNLQNKVPVPSKPAPMEAPLALVGINIPKDRDPNAPRGMPDGKGRPQLTVVPKPTARPGVAKPIGHPNSPAPEKKGTSNQFVGPQPEIVMNKLPDPPPVTKPVVETKKAEVQTAAAQVDPRRAKRDKRNKNKGKDNKAQQTPTPAPVVAASPKKETPPPVVAVKPSGPVAKPTPATAPAAPAKPAFKPTPVASQATGKKATPAPAPAAKKQPPIQVAARLAPTSITTTVLAAMSGPPPKDRRKERRKERRLAKQGRK